MRTSNYNPSPFEVDFIKALENALPQLSGTSNLQWQVTSVTPRQGNDNPGLVIEFKDKDGDPHTLIVQAIQRPDSF